MNRNQAMTVAELIGALQRLPQDARVCYVWDGGARSYAVWAYASNSGDVLLTDAGEAISMGDMRDLPKSFESVGEVKYGNWYAPGGHEDYFNEPPPIAADADRTLGTGAPEVA